ncbi:hypothetical protein AB0E10_27435 [Streptomyces sp. NPDC048045]|uniref:hypothetical protein n=1 Tax=Streptomyces sp. NPDC048045 TaxID=3154710 RepID=UPI0034335739
MSGWSGGRNSEEGRGGGPAEDRGRAAWSPGGTPPPWAYEETRTTPVPPPADPGPAAVPPLPPPPWAAATQAGGPPLAAPVPAHAGGPPAAASLPAHAGGTPAAAPAPSYDPRRARGGRLIALVAAMALVGAAAGLGVWYLGRDDGGGGSPSATAAAGGVTVSTSTSASVPASSPPAGTTASGASPSAPGVSARPPAGYRLVRDPVGYTLAVPEGWTRRQEQGEKAAVVFYDSPSDGRQLQIFGLAEPTVTESLDLAENDPGYGYSHRPGYRALARRSGADWAELTYRYDDRDKGARRVVDHRFRAADGTLYAIRASGPESLSDGLVRRPLTTALASFCPTATGCA